MPLQLRRGLNADRIATTFAEGEPVWTTDTNKLYVGDGVTPGAIAIGGDQSLNTNSNVTFNSALIATTATVATLKFGDGTTMTTAATGGGGASTSTYYNLTVTNILSVGESTSTQLKISRDSGAFKITSGGNSLRIEDVEYLYLNPNSAVIINESNPGQSFLNVNTVRPSGTYTAVTVASTLTVTGNATANSIVTQDLVSSGGFPLNDNGMALIRASNTQTPAMVASNYTAGLLPEVVVRGYGQNRPGGPTSTTNGAPAVILESSRGTHTAPTTLAAADFIGSFSAGGYNGTRWSSDVNLYSAELIATAAGATWAGNATTTTNAGARFFMRIQPPNVQLNTTSRVSPYVQTWTGAASTATGSPPVLTISEGSGVDGNTPTLTPTGGVGSLSTGHGRVALVKMNTTHQIFGVPTEDTAADNPTLPGTNTITFISGRRSGTSGRRNKVLLDDTLGELRFSGQTADNATSVGSIGASITVTAAENFGASASGSTIKFLTTPIGTNAGVTNRLVINSTNISHSSGVHDFSDTSANAIASLSTSTAQFFVPLTYDRTYGCFHKVTNVTVPAADTVYDFDWYTTATAHISNHNVTVTSGEPTRVNIAAAGAYRVFVELAGVNVDNADRTAWIWLAKNGTDISETTVKFTLTKDTSTMLIKDWIIDSVAANDYIQVRFAVDNASGISLQYNAEQTTPYARPAAPSATITVAPVGA
jgi:hypothetical protein